MKIGRSPLELLRADLDAVILFMTAEIGKNPCRRESGYIETNAIIRLFSISLFFICKK